MSVKKNKRISDKINYRLNKRYENTKANFSKSFYVGYSVNIWDSFYFEKVDILSKIRRRDFEYKKKNILRAELI